MDEGWQIFEQILASFFRKFSRQNGVYFMNEYYEITIIYASRNPRMKQHNHSLPFRAARAPSDGDNGSITRLRQFIRFSLLRQSYDVLSLGERVWMSETLYILRLVFVTRFRSFLLDYDQNTAQYGSTYMHVLRPGR